MSRKKALNKLDPKVEGVGEKGALEVEEETDDEKVARLIADFAQDPPMQTAADLQVRATAFGSHIDNEKIKTLFAPQAASQFLRSEKESQRRCCAGKSSQTKSLLSRKSFVPPPAADTC